MSAVPIGRFSSRHQHSAEIEAYAACKTQKTDFINNIIAAIHPLSAHPAKQLNAILNQSIRLEASAPITRRGDPQILS